MNSTNDYNCCALKNNLCTLYLLCVKVELTVGDSSYTTLIAQKNSAWTPVFFSEMRRSSYILKGNFVTKYCNACDAKKINFLNKAEARRPNPPLKAYHKIRFTTENTDIGYLHRAGRVTDLLEFHAYLYFSPCL